MPQIAKVDNPDSATHFLCDRAPYPDEQTHHLINARCRYCHKLDTAIRKEAGL